MGGRDARRYLKILDGIAGDESESAANRIRASEIMLERGYGKAPAFAPIEGENPLELSDTDRAIDATLDELAARREATAADAGPPRVVADTSPG